MRKGGPKKKAGSAAAASPSASNDAKKKVKQARKWDEDDGPVKTDYSNPSEAKVLLVFFCLSPRVAHICPGCLALSSSNPATSMETRLSPSMQTTGIHSSKVSNKAIPCMQPINGY